MPPTTPAPEVPSDARSEAVSPESVSEPAPPECSSKGASSETPSGATPPEDPSGTAPPEGSPEPAPSESPSEPAPPESPSEPAPSEDPSEPAPPEGPSEPAPGRLGANLLYFARTLRAAGLPVGSGAVLDALRAVEAVGVARRDDFYWALHAVFVRRADQRPLFDEAFHVFWRNPKLLERVASLLLPTVHTPPRGDAKPLSRRLSEALFAGGEGRPRAKEAGEEVELDATLTWSDREVLRTRDFEQMSAAELAAAKAAIARLRPAIAPAPTRRYRPHPRGARIDMRTTFRRSLRTGSGAIPLARRRRLRKPAPLVVLCDVSGSMSRYSRVLLHFTHALTRDRARVSSFVFGTRLTNITRQLRDRDVDVAVERASAEVADWSGGTRIGHCLDVFNREWSRRVCGQGAVVLFISDGLDRDAGDGLEPQVERLRKSCRRLVWLNPLLRYDGFEPKAAGMRALLPHVDELRPVHNLESLEDLSAALVEPPARLPGQRP